MSIDIRLPKDFRLFSTVQIFESTFNIPTLGKYDFTIPANREKKIMDIVNTQLYYIDYVILGGTISEEIYLNSIDPLDVPRFYLSMKNTRKKVFSKDFPLVSFQTFETAQFINSDQSQDELLLTMEGRLNQIADTVGISAIRLRISMMIYEISDCKFIREHRDRNK